MNRDEITDKDLQEMMNPESILSNEFGKFISCYSKE